VQHGLIDAIEDITGPDIENIARARRKSHSVRLGLG
jgi:hypothetical protein